MPKRIAILSDTHMPRGARRLPPACAEVIAGADEVIHGGDFSELAIVEEVTMLNARLVAVHGNVDSAEVTRRLPETATLDVEGVTIGVVHDAGPAKGRLARMRRQFPSCEAVVFGHSHLPLHEEEDGFQIFNPGSPTERRRSPRPSFGFAEVEQGSFRFQLVWVEER